MQFYQLTRLLYDYMPALYEHFERHDISPTLYAAPWFLTLFASQFSISFVTRLFDILFLMGIEAIFRVSLVLLDTNSEALLGCDGFETIMEYLKEVVPNMDVLAMESLFDRVFTLDIGAKLNVYEVEYRVFQEELIHMSKSTGSSKIIVNRRISNESTDKGQQHRDQVQELESQVQMYQSKYVQLQSQCDTYLSTIRRLEQRVRACEDEKDALVHSVSALQKRNEKLELLAKTAGAADNNDSDLESKQKSRSERFSLESAPVFSISRASESRETHGSANGADPEGDDDDEDEEGLAIGDEYDIDINSDSDCGDRDPDHRQTSGQMDRTHSDTSNLSI
ncbi:unnamed protein product [Oppiella nova]|uniref:Rab-GAP TBC domain-containing protein n=1 Tax=Oppiella nova TaxID=334625 RepID=A0A7R9M4A9_9ACAR|nr:unnamed protein product [Oppiella nova]CAG2169180.1 unnamed protein product [Oppiella nova]